MKALDPRSVEARTLVEDGLEFCVSPLGGFAHPDHLVIVKQEESIAAYRELLRRFDRPKMVELGIAYGGSVAFFALVAKPEKLVALEISPDRIALLDQVLASRGLAEQVKLHYGVDQSDRRKIEKIVHDEFGNDELDLVIDDASHLYGPTIQSFDLLFPRLRPGGLFVLEDWSCDETILSLLRSGLEDPRSILHQWAQDVVDRAASETDQTTVALEWLRDTLPRADRAVPLSRLTARLSLAACHEDAGIASVSVTEGWTVVERSQVVLDRDTYSLIDAAPTPSTPSLPPRTSSQVVFGEARFTPS